MQLLFTALILLFNAVHRLRPGDIKVVGAMGDSLTAGFGAGGTPGSSLLDEYRGRSFRYSGKNIVDKLSPLYSF